MIVTFFNASGIDFGNFLNAHLKPKKVLELLGTYNFEKRLFFEAISSATGIAFHFTCVAALTEQIASPALRA